MRKNLLLVIILVAIQLSGCNMFCDKQTGKTIEKKQNLEFFNELEITGNAEIIFEIGDLPALTLKTDKTYMPLVQIKQNDTEVSIKIDKCIDRASDLKIHITTTDIYRISVDGAIRFAGNNKIATEKLKLYTAGVSDMKLNIDTRELQTTIKGSGDVTLKGFAAEHDFEVSGSGNLEAYQLLSKTCHVDISGAGSAKIHVSDKLTGDVSGSGDLIYKGKPRKIDTDVSGSGSVKSK